MTFNGLIFFIRLPPGGECLWLDRLSGVGVNTMSWHTPFSDGLRVGYDLGLILDVELSV